MTTLSLGDESARTLLGRLGVALGRPAAGGGALALAANRDERSIDLLAGDGTRVPVDPLLGLRPFHTARIARALALDEAGAEECDRLVRALWQAMFDGDAVRIDLSGLSFAAEAAGAARVAVTLDRLAASRHPEWAGMIVESPGTRLEDDLYAAGAIGVELDPEGVVCGILSGAGLMMSCLDILTDRGVRPRVMVDMQGLPLRGEEGMRPIIGPVARIDPRVVLIGGRFQAPVTDGFARAVLGVHAETPLKGEVHVWVQGNKAEEGRAIFASAGFAVHEELTDALEAVVAAARLTG